MAVTAATMRSDFSGFLPAERSAPIFNQARRISAVQRLVRQVPLGAEGKDIPVVTGRLTAGWVSEGGTKPATKGTMALKTITPKKLAAIAVVSAEVVRANPGGYMDELRPQIGEAFASAFDYAALHDAGPDGTPGGGPFATYIDQTTKEVEFGTAAASAGGAHQDLVSGLKLLVNEGKKLTGFAFDDRAEPILLGSVDSQGRPLFIDLPSDTDASILARDGRIWGRPTSIGEGVFYYQNNAVGYMGDWREAAWGVVGGISYDVSTQATVTISGALVSLWENNLLAVRAEAEYGFLVNDTAAFVRLENVTS